MSSSGWMADDIYEKNEAELLAKPIHELTDGEAARVLALLESREKSAKESRSLFLVSLVLLIIFVIISIIII